MLDINEFSAKRKYMNFSWNVLSVAIFAGFSLFSLYYHHNTQSTMFRTVNIIIFAICIFIMLLQIYSYFFLKKEMEADIIINSDQIIISEGPARKPKAKYIKDISKITVPKWDDLVEIVFRDKTKIKLSLYGFKEDDKKILRELLFQIKANFEGDVNQTKSKEKLSEGYIINGKSYIK